MFFLNFDSRIVNIDHSFQMRDINISRFMKLMSHLLPYCPRIGDSAKPELESACLLELTDVHSLNKNKRRRRKILSNKRIIKAELKVGKKFWFFNFIFMWFSLPLSLIRKL